MPEDFQMEKLLRGAFKGEEFDYVTKHPIFIEQLHKSPATIEGFEKLVQIGSLLLEQRAQLVTQKFAAN